MEKSISEIRIVMGLKKNLGMPAALAEGDNILLLEVDRKKQRSNQ